MVFVGRFFFVCIVMCFLSWCIFYLRAMFIWFLLFLNERFSTLCIGWLMIFLFERFVSLCEPRL